MTAVTFGVERVAGAAADFHSRAVAPEPAPALWRFDVLAPAVVLGSRQRVDVVDAAYCRAAGTDVVVRRSGGGAVLMLPGELLWIDVVVSPGWPGWSDDVAATMVAVGEAWCAALDPMVDGSLRVHRGAMERSAWSELVCFDGLGAGEVLVGDRKLVGISQRRTRTSARLQCAVHLRYDPVDLERCLAGSLPSVAHRPVATLDANADLDGLVDRLADALGG